MAWHQREKEFFTPERLAHERAARMAPPRGELLIVSCRSGNHLAASVVAEYRGFLAEARSQQEVAKLDGVDFQFSDSETCVRLERHVAGCDVFLFQSLLDPACGRSIDENYLAFLLAADALRQWGAHHVTAVLPYLAYARQDKPTRHQREPTTARFMADLSLRAGIDRLVTWHPHSAQLQGFYEGIRVDVLEAPSFFAEAFRRFRNRNDAILVAPDVGASKFVTYVGRALELPSAIASKMRPRPEEAVTTEIIGDFSGRFIWGHSLVDTLVQ
jgi:ribose-phosphate pyrophosphokinase